MSITDELREWWVRKFPVMDKELHEDFTAIADRIDAEHERQLEVLYRDMSDAEWMRLPKDAEGVPIHLGDMMHGTCPSGKYVCGEVSAIGDNKFWLINVQFSLHPGYMRHHHEPTVEDVLRKFAHVGIRIGAKDGIKAGEIDFYADEEAIAEYAAKLQLRGDAE